MKICIRKTAKTALFCFILCLSLLLCACDIIIPAPTGTSTSTSTEPSADEYVRLLQEGASNKTENAECQSVADWLVYWGAKLDDAKLELVESIYGIYSIYELNDALTVAKECVSLYCEYLFDTAPLSDMRMQTDLWLYAYTASIGDPYANYMSQEDYAAYNEEQSGQYAGIGVSVLENVDPAGIYVSDVFKNSPAKEAGIEIGDVIVAVNGTSVSSVGYEAAVDMVKGEIGTPVVLDIYRDGDVFTVTAIRAQIEQPAIEYRMLEQGSKKIGYIYISTFASEVVAAQFKDAVDALTQEGAEALLFDVRHNTGGLVTAVIEMLDYLLIDGKPLMRNGYYDGTVEELVGEDGHKVDLPFGVLCSDYSASASELFISALMDYSEKGDCEAFSVGIKTYGKGCMQSMLEFTDGSALLVTVAYYDPPYGENYDGIGITPDYVVELAPDYQYVNVTSIPEGQDTQLQKALDLFAGE
ncbi:MAG: PDZ domain-containing protein [Clostridia bacterium]|nr:PDZ domain-containing protein [Clostridia bacterium]